MKDLLGKNLVYKLVAVFLAVVLWFNASDQQNVYQEQVFKVPLEIRNLPSSLVVTDLPASVEVEVEGKWGVVDKVNARDFSAFVGLETYKAGKNEVPVEVTVPPGVRLVNVNPSTIIVQLANMASVQLPVVADIRGGAAEGFRALPAVIEPAEVIVNGPQTLLDKIRSARVKVNLNDAQEDWVKVLPITLNGQSKDDAFNVTIEPKTAKVYIPIVPAEQGKVVPIEVTFQGEPPEGYVVGTVTVEPDGVEITGTQEEINKITSIKTLPVNVEGRESSFSENIKLDVPGSVKVSRQAGVDVFVEIKKTEQPPQ